MNARLCSLLVAGGVVLAGVPNGSLAVAPPETEAAQRSVTLQKAFLLPTDGSGARLQIEIPGFTGTPRLQVLSNPYRVVVDLPGVNRGNQLSKKDLAALTHPLIEKYRVAQFAVSPAPITRLVLEVVPGTQVDVSRQPNGIMLILMPGNGPVQAKLVQSAPTPAQFDVIAKASPAISILPDQIKVSEVVGSVPLVSVPTEIVANPLEPVAMSPGMVSIEPAPALKPADTSTGLSSPAVAPPTEVKEVKVKEVKIVVAADAVAEPIKTIISQSPVLQTPAPVPSIGAPYRLLPVITASALMPTSLGYQPQDSKIGKGNAATSVFSQQNGRTLGEQETRYTGAPITIDIPSADLRTFLLIIADSMHLNLIMDQDIQGTYTFKFTDTPADLVLDMILKNASLGKEISHGVMRVAKIEKLQKEENDRKALDEAKALAGELQSVTRPLSYAKVGEVKAILDKVISKRGSIISDDRTNTLIITDLPRYVPLIDDLIAQLDVQIQQVEISARVVEANGSFDKAFGVKWPTTGTLPTGANGNPVAVNGPSWNSINNRPGDGQNTTTLGFIPGGSGGTTSINGASAEYWVSFLSNRISINFILQALEKEGKVKIVSQPKLVTQNNKAAKILAGQKIPYPSQQGGAAGGAITVAFVDANLELDVTPQITNDGTILMDLKIEKSEADFGQSVGGSPTILRKSIQTTVLVRDGGTAILGGVYTNNTSTGTTGVPFLSKLPMIGWLFKNKVTSEKNAELLIFITPRIIKN